MDLDGIRERAAAATPAPWMWTGNVDTHNIHLRGKGDGFPDILTFRRSGMQGGRPWFCGIPDRGMIQDCKPLAIYEVCRSATDRDDPRVYRGDVVGFRHPDATFIAHARQDIDDLLAMVEALHTELDSLRTLEEEAA